ncbi:MAG: DUF192 domain-containing protein [Candidatus Aenigmarchaeota archaeon]|nr:DUF192 domain-containing protein [Candidatus Aenigmarchaeota archaeon]
MRREFLIIAVLVLFFLVSAQKPLEEKTIYFSSGVKNVTLLVKIADTEETRTKGLMFVNSLENNEGMLFIFADESERTFWMKNALIPLDMIFVTSNGTVVDVIESAKPCEKDPCATYPSIYPAKYVVEVNAGFTRQNGIITGARFFGTD